MKFNPVNTLEPLQPNVVRGFGILAQVSDSMCLGSQSLSVDVARRSIVSGM